MTSLLTASEMFDLLPPEVDATGWLPIPGEGDANPDVVLIKGYPHGWDAGKKRPLMGNDGLAIRRALLDLDIPYYATCAFPFYRGGQPLRANVARQAAPVVAEEMRRLQPSKVLLLGADAARWTPTFDFPFRRFNEVLGRSIQVGETTYRIAHAPAAIATNPAAYAEFLRAVQELLHPESVSVADAPDEERYLTIKNRLQAQAVLRKMGDRVAVDIETNSLDHFTAKILTLQVSWEEGKGYAFPWSLFTPEEWAGFFLGKRCVFQNGSYDVKVLAVNGLHLTIAEDTLLMHSLVDETPGTHSMEAMAQRYLGIDKWSELVNYDDMESVDLDVLGRYGARDTDLTLRLANVFKPLVVDRHIHTVLHRGQNALARSELRGVRVDRAKAEQFDREIQAALHDKAEYLEQHYGLKNANSPQQVARLLYEDLGLPTQKLRGQVTTANDAISQFQESHAVVRDILEYRHLTKASGTYLRNILALTERDGRYHPDYRLAATETGRLAERLITLIPRAEGGGDMDLGKQYQMRLRELFTPDEGYLMVGADYRGLEVGMAAHLSNDPQLIEDYNTNLDTHSVVAIEAFGLDIPIEPRATLKQRVSAEHAYYRSLAKAGTFTWLYSGSEATIARQLGISNDTATKIMDALRSRYQGVARWQEAVKDTIRRVGSISTPWGRTRRFLVTDTMDRKVIEDQLRQGINFPTQGMSSDVNLEAFSRVEARGIETLFPVHDAIYAQAPIDQVDRVAEEVKRVMESVLPSPVRFEADVHVGETWADL